MKRIEKLRILASNTSAHTIPELSVKSGDASAIVELAEAAEMFRRCCPAIPTCPCSVCTITRALENLEKESGE